MVIDYTFVIFLMMCALSDLMFRKVYNAIVLPALLLGLGLNLMYHGTAGLAWSLLGAAAGFAFLFPAYLLGGVGAGDVKFLAACGALVGLKFLAWGTLYGAVIGGIYSIILLVVNRKALQTLKEVFTGLFLFLTLRSRESINFDKGKSIHIPYVVFLSAGMLVHWLEVSGVK